MIEVDSGDYFVAKTREESWRQAETAHPDKAFFLLRIGYKASSKLR
jgi:hypothetical protein